MTTTTTASSAAQLPAEVESLMRSLRLPHARAIAADVLATARAQRWDPTEVIKALLTEESAGRARSMLAARRKAAGFPTGKTFDVWDPNASSIPLPTQQALRTLEWVGRRENLVVCGPAGTGKTFFLEALGQKVIEAGMPVAWFTLEQIGMLVRAHRADDSLGKAVAKIVRAELVVIDDVGLLPVGADAAEGLYRIVEAAYERRSVAISSNLHPSGFDELMPKTLATATVEHPIKKWFRRRRPFVSLVEAIIVGRKPGSYSFPSGHSAAAFAGALLLAREYPGGARGFFGLAWLVAFSRIYLGAHYPGDVISGSLLGMVLARIYSRVLRKMGIVPK